MNREIWERFFMVQVRLPENAKLQLGFIKKRL